MRAADQMSDGLVQDESIPPVHVPGGRRLGYLLQLRMPLVFQDKRLVLPDDCLIYVICFLSSLVFFIVQLFTLLSKVNAVTVESLCVNLREEWNISGGRENLCEPTPGEAFVDGGDVRRQGAIVAQKSGALADAGQDLFER